MPEKGWIVVTPVYSSDRDRAILVRRGWVPDTWRQQAAAAAAGGSAEAAALSGVGVVSGGEKGSAVTFANDPENDFWQLLDPVAMVRLCSICLQVARLHGRAPKQSTRRSRVRQCRTLTSQARPHVASYTTSSMHACAVRPVMLWR